MGGKRLTGSLGRSVGFLPSQAAPDFHPAPRSRYYCYILRDAKGGVKGGERRKVMGSICLPFCQQEPGFRSLGRTRSCHRTSQTLGFPRSYLFLTTVKKAFLLFGPKNAPKACSYCMPVFLGSGNYQGFLAENLKKIPEYPSATEAKMQLSP